MRDTIRNQWSFFYQGLIQFRRAFTFLKVHRLRHWYLIAGSISVFAVLSVGWLMGRVKSVILDEIKPWLGKDKAESESWFVLNEILNCFNDIIEFSAQLLTTVVLFWIQIKLAKLIVLILLSPFMAWASQQLGRKTDDKNGHPQEDNWWRAFRRGVQSAFLLTGLEVFLGLGLIGLGMILPFYFPPLGIVSMLIPFISAGLSAWFFGAAIFDYHHEISGLSAMDGLKRSWELRGAVLGIGLPLYLLLMLPVIGTFLGPVFGAIPALVASHSMAKY